MGVPVLGGNAGGTSSFLDGGSSNKFLVTTTLLLEPDVEELKGSSVLAFNKENSNIHTFSAILLLLFFPPQYYGIYLKVKVWTSAKILSFAFKDIIQLLWEILKLHTDENYRKIRNG